ncbi:MAG: xanthine dehydrogenase family protein molybdopterin-binding subunit [Anaerolineae bacterium]|nr:xanthine dehydrogenase family protein molybdopterin-binding subunit [Anaerolineae bacterium]
MIGAPIKRREDPELLHGQAKFTADLTLPGMLHLAVLHSPHAHAVIKSIDTSAAEKMPGVVRVFTGKDVVDKMMRLPVIWKPAGVESHFPPHPYGLPGAQTALATDRARYVGEWLAIVAAETREQAYAALPAIQVEYELLPVVVDAEEAMKAGAPQLHAEAPNNLCTHFPIGDKAAAEQSVAEAEVVVKQKISIPRQVHNAVETRASIGRFDPESGEYTLWTNTQIPAGNHYMIASLVLGVPYNKVRVIAPHIGGAYGSKGYLYPDAPLVLVLSRELGGRPVKWVDTREGLFRTTVHARGQTHYATIAGSHDGKISAFMSTNYASLGAYSSHNGPGAPTALTGRSMTGAYAIPHPFYECYLTYTNTNFVGPARGAGRFESNLVIERMIDLFAREIGMDPAEVRRKNFVQTFPYDNGLGWNYDSGNYAGALDRALAMVGYDEIPQRKAEARQRGKRLGVGLASYVTVAGVGPSPRMGREGLIGSTWGNTVLRVHQTGDVTLITGSQPHGQSHVTTFSQIVAQELGVDPERIEVIHSDTKGVPYAQGSYGSRTYSVEGASIYEAAQRIKEKARLIGAHLMEVAVEDVEFVEGKARVKGSPEKAMALPDIAVMAWFAWNLPQGMEPGLEVTTYWDPADFNFPFGTHIAVVEVDEQTGQVDLVRYVSVDDVGNVGNAMVVEGQMHGSIAFGIGPALMETESYTPDGQLVANSLREYAIPRASMMPHFELDRTVTPTPLNALGAKGAGDVSQPAPAPAILNAVVDALADLGVRHIDNPVTSEKVWRILQSAPHGKGQ